MLCCFRPPATRDSQPAAGSGPHEQQELNKASGSAPASADAGNQRWKSGSGLDPAQQQQQQHQLQQHSQLQHQQQQVPLEPLARLGEGAALAPGLQPTTSPHGSHDAAANAAAVNQQHHITTQQQQQQLRVSEDAGQQAPQNDVLQLVALLQELLGLSTASPKQPLSKAMGLLVVRLPVDWACLHVFSSSGRVVMQVGDKNGFPISLFGMVYPVCSAGTKPCIVQSMADTTSKPHLLQRLPCRRRDMVSDHAVPPQTVADMSQALPLPPEQTAPALCVNNVLQVDSFFPGPPRACGSLVVC